MRFGKLLNIVLLARRRQFAGQIRKMRRISSRRTLGEYDSSIV